IDDGLIIYGSFLNHAPSRLSNFDTHHYIPFIAKINMNREIEWWQHLKAWDEPEERIEFFEIVKIKDGFLGSGYAWRSNSVEMWMIRLDSNGCLTDEFCELPPPPPDKAEFLIYPNPSEWGDFFLRVPENTKGEVQIIALDGRIVDTFSLDGTSTIYERHLEHLSRAGYLVRVINGRENVWVGKWFR
ncbi:MAG: T9SS type A sorting domain-containing protein, partial [Cryomorphaceae bacterium]|nr:T9SS type A sorting domain-containing protein [Cryomorphaceae bacterium]